MNGFIFSSREVALDDWIAIIEQPYYKVFHMGSTLYLRQRGYVIGRVHLSVCL